MNSIELSLYNGKGGQNCVLAVLSTGDGLLPGDPEVSGHIVTFVAFDGCRAKMLWQKGQLGAATAACF